MAVDSGWGEPVPGVLGGDPLAWQTVPCLVSVPTSPVGTAGRILWDAVQVRPLVRPPAAGQAPGVGSFFRREHRARRFCGPAARDEHNARRPGSCGRPGRALPGRPPSPGLSPRVTCPAWPAGSPPGRGTACCSTTAASTRSTTSSPWRWWASRCSSPSRQVGPAGSPLPRRLPGAPALVPGPVCPE